MDEGGPPVIDPQICEFRAFDAGFGTSEPWSCVVGNENHLQKADREIPVKSDDLDDLEVNRSAQPRCSSMRCVAPLKGHCSK